MDNEKKVGRPKEKNPRKVQLKIMVTEEENNQIEELAVKMKMNKSQLIRNLLLGNIEDLDFFHKLKLVPLIQNIMAFKDKLKGFDYWEDIKEEAYEIKDSEEVLISKKDYEELLKLKENEKSEIS